MEDVRLTNGELLSVKINFLTLYLIKKNKIDERSDQLRHLEYRLKKAKDASDQKKVKEINTKIENIQIEIAAQIIYVILRSNGKKVDFEESLMLCPVDTTQLKKLISGFQEALQQVKKKETMKM